MQVVGHYFLSVISNWLFFLCESFSHLPSFCSGFEASQLLHPLLRIMNLRCAGSDTIWFFPRTSKHSCPILPHQQEHLESTLAFTLDAILNGLSFLKGVLNKSTDKHCCMQCWEEICPGFSRPHAVLCLCSQPFVSMSWTTVTWQVKKKQRKESCGNGCVFHLENIENVICCTH